MNPHLQRALLLLEQSRHELAEQQLRQALAADPNSAVAHAVLAICLAHREQFREASQEADTAVHLAPDEPYPHYARSIVLHSRNHYSDAEAAVGEAIALDPYRTEFFAHLARLQFDQRRWRDSLEAAEEGLRIDPEDVDCTNLRAMALVKLGRKDLASEAIATALRRDPEDAVTHANQGWTLIEQGQHEKAMEHFREALRLDPELQWARQGIVEALKSRYFLYRIMLGYFLWMMKLSGRAQWGVVLGGYLGYRMLRGIAGANPAWRPWILPLLVLYIVFAVMTWIASPMFNLLLRLNRYGRLALSRQQIITSNWVGLCVAGAILCLAVYVAAGVNEVLPAALVCGLLIPPLSRIYDCDPGWPRTSLVLITLALALSGVVSTLLMISASLVSKPAAELLGGVGLLLFVLFILGAFASQFAANALVMATPRR